MTYNSLFLFLL